MNRYGLPPLTNIPDGFTSLLEIYGKGRNREPLLVEFVYPVDWVTILPNNDENGEEGTIQAGQMSAGDTATLYVTPGKIDVSLCQTFSMESLNISHDVLIHQFRM